MSTFTTREGSIEVGTMDMEPLPIEEGVGIEQSEGVELGDEHLAPRPSSAMSKSTQGQFDDNDTELASLPDSSTGSDATLLTVAQMEDSSSGSTGAVAPKKSSPCFSCSKKTIALLAALAVIVIIALSAGLTVPFMNRNKSSSNNEAIASANMAAPEEQEQIATTTSTSTTYPPSSSPTTGAPSSSPTVLTPFVPPLSTGTVSNDFQEDDDDETDGFVRRGLGVRGARQ